MAKILILNLPLHGHVNPTLALTKKLIEQGHEVTYLINEDFKEILTQTGANLEVYDISLDKKLNIPQLFSLMTKIYFKALEIGPNYDCIIYEMAFMLGLPLGKKLKKKTICLTSTFALNEHITSDSIHGNKVILSLIRTKFFHKLLSKILLRDKRLKDIDLVHELIEESPDLNIVYTSKEFQIHKDDFDSEKYVFIGPSVNGRSTKSNIPFDKMKGKIIYISLGTISSGSHAFYQKCIDAFGNKNISVIISIGKQHTVEEFGEIPDNIYLYPFVSQVEVLKHTDLFISHCGMNSVNEALYYGIPILGIPQRGDQPIVANRIKELGLGDFLNKKKVTSESLFKMSKTILENTTYYKNALAMEEAMQHAGGETKAVAAIEAYLKK